MQQIGNSYRKPTLWQFRATAVFKLSVLSMVYGNTVLASTLLENEHTSAQKNSLDVVKI